MHRWASKRLTLLPLADGAGPQTILDTPDLKYGFRFSPDGKYVVYVSQESGVPEIYVAAFPSFAVKRKISAGFGLSPVWARSGKEIFYLGSNGPGRNMMSVEVKVGAKLDAGTPKLLFQFRPGGTYFSVTADGKRFLSTEMSQQEKAETEAPQISLVLHWTAGIQ